MITNNSQQLAEANLRLAADVEERTGWTVARLIAASVEIDANTGRPSKGAPQAQVSKIGARRAAKLMRKSDHTIRAYLAAWNAAAEDGLCKPSADLTPEDGQTANLPEADWSEYYTNTKPRGVGVGQVKDRMRDDEGYATEVARQLPPGVALTEITNSAETVERIASSPEAKRFVEEVIKASPEVQQAARKALDQTHTERPESNFSEREALADEREEADRKGRGGVRYVVADGLLATAKKKIREAIEEVHEAKLADEHRDLIRERVSEIIRLAQMLRAEVDGNASVDWDAELAALMGGE